MKKPMNQSVYDRLANHGITVISPSTFKFYGCDCDVIKDELINNGFVDVYCRIIHDDYPTGVPLKERLEDTVVIEGKKQFKNNL